MSTRGDPPYRPSGGGRWDPERFFRERELYEKSGGRVHEHRDIIDRDRQHVYEEHDHFEQDYGRPPPAVRARVDLEAERSGRGGRGAFVAQLSHGHDIRDDNAMAVGRVRYQDDRFQDFQEEDRFRRRETAYYGDDRGSVTSSASSVVPYRSGPPRSRRQSIHIEREYAVPPTRGPPPRPGFIRRQSSLDTFDRRPLPRYGDHEDFRASAAITVPVPPPQRRRSPLQRFEERDYEEIRVVEPDQFGDDDFRDFHEQEQTTREYRFKVSETDVAVQNEFPKRGKTRMPRRLVEKTAIDVLGYPFEEEMDHIVVLKALNKEQIDEVVRVSKEMRSSRTNYVQQTTNYVEPAPPLALPPPPPPPPPQVFEQVRTEIVLPPPEPAPLELIRQVVQHDEVIAAPHESRESRSERKSSKSVRSKSARSSKSRRRKKIEVSGSSSSSSDTEREIVIEKREESNRVHGPLTMFVSDKDTRKEERHIKAEIKALEREEKALKLERQRDMEIRKAERIRESGDKSEIVGSVKVERNKKEYDTDSKLLKLAMMTLT